VGIDDANLRRISPLTPLRVLRATFAPSAFCFCLAATAQDAPILKRVDDHYNHLKSLRTRYTERYTGMGMTRTESGTLMLRKPGQMRWQYDRPAGKLFILDGKFAWFYTPGDAQAQRIPAKQMDDLRTPLRFLLGHTQLKKELESIAVTPKNGGFHIAGVPKGMENRIRELSLDVTASGAIAAMKLEEMDGATTEFSFAEEHENVPTNPADFIFEAPPGVAIVDATAPI
jgi:outer membrane lipoprotein carrier protein